MVAETGPHGPIGSLVVMVSVTVPADTSPALGVYVAVAELALLNVPVPEVVQVIEEAPPPNDPPSVTADPLHEVLFGPALTVAAEFTVTLAEACGLEQPFCVTTSVYAPE